MKTIRELADALKEAHQWIEWDRAMLEDFHAYGQVFGTAGANVFECVLADALRAHGYTLALFRETYATMPLTEIRQRKAGRA